MRLFKPLFALFALTFLLASQLISPAAAQTLPQVTSGLAWLQSQVNASGSVNGESTSIATVHQARSETYLALKQLGAVTSAQVDSVAAEADGNTEYLARKIIVFTKANRDASALVTALLAAQNTDGGFGAYPGGVSDALDTAWALLALNASASTTAIPAALTYLQSQQGADGSFGVYGQPSIYVSAISLAALGGLAGQYALSTPIQSTITYLLAQRSADGSWSGSPYLTGLAFTAIRLFQAQEPLASTTRTYLVASQAANGSWGNGDPYVSALALTALQLTTVTPVNPNIGGITGIIKDLQTGNNLSGVTVTLTGPSTATLTTSASGQLQFTNLQPGFYNLLISLPQYGTISAGANVVGGQTTDLGALILVKLLSGASATVSGSVVDSVTNLPIVGAAITITGTTLSATTDSNGNYEIAFVPIQTFITVQVVATGYLTAKQAPTFSIQADRVNVVSFAMVRNPGSGTGAYITGTILSGVTGLPLSGVKITAGGVTATTIASGAYSMFVPQAAFASGFIQILTALTGYDQVNTTTALGNNNAITFSPRLYPTGTTPANVNKTGATGVVVDAVTGQPLAGVTVQVTGQNFATTVTTGADGRFTYAGSGIGTVFLAYSLSGYVGLTDQVTPPPAALLDVGQVRLRKFSVVNFLPDLTVTAVSRTNAITDPQSLILSGSVSATIANVGTVGVSTDIQLLAFVDVNRDGVYTPGVDTPLGKAVLSGGLAAGAIANVNIPVQGQMPFRDAPISVWADSNQTVIERSKSNNVRSSAADAAIIPNALAFSPVLKWQWNGNTFSSFGSIAMPVVGPLVDTNGDGKVDDKDVPTVVIVDAAGIDNSAGRIRALSGKDGHEIWAQTASNLLTASEASPAIGDIDGDGKPDVVYLLNGGGMAALNGADGSVKWINTTVTPAAGSGGVSIVDLDGNGRPSILNRNYVVNNDGTLRFKFNPSFNFVSGQGVVPVVADLDGDGKPEIIAGNMAVHADGTTYWQNTAVDNTCRGAIANFDGSGRPQYVCTGGGRLYLLDYNGTLIWGPVLVDGGNGRGLPVVADFDGDGVPDIGVSGITKYSVFNSDGSLKWTKPMQDGSSGVGSVAFDFDGTGKNRIVHLDETTFRVFDGATGNTVFSLPNQSATSTEFPVVVDVDGDGHADILVVQNNKNPGLRVFQDVNNAWVRTRKIWNEQNYRVTNVNDDGTIPRHEANSWQVHNTYRDQLQLQGGGAGVPDLTASYVRIQDRGGQGISTITVRIGNGGGYQTDPGVKVAFYKNAVGTLLATAQTTKTLVSGDYEDVSISIPGSLASISQVIIVADDNGAGVNAIQDFDRTNNTVSFALSALQGSLSITDITDAASYGANAVVNMTATVANAGSFAATATVRFTIEAADGSSSVLTLPAVAPANVSATASKQVSTSWNTATTYVGNYRVKAELIGSDGRPYSTAYAPFAIAGIGGATNAKVTSNKTAYPPFDTIVLHDRIQNGYLNQNLTGLIAKTTITAPDNSTFWTNTSALPQLVPGALKDLSYNVPLSAAAPGAYTAMVQVMDASSAVVAVSQTSFVVQSSADTGVGLAGSISATPWQVNLGDTINLAGSVTNNGNSPVALPAYISIVNPVDGSLVQQFPLSLSVAVGGQQAVAQSWLVPGNLSAGTYLVAFTVQAASQTLLLSQDTIVLGAESAFAFVPQLNVARSAVATSNSVTVAGLVAPTSIAITGGQYSINGGAFTSQPGVTQNGDVVVVRQTASANFNTKTTAALTVGTFTAPFDVTTVAASVVPNAFSFTAQTNVAMGAVVTSSPATITGIDVAVPISISGGQYSINGGVFTSLSGLVSPNDVVVVRQTASSQPSITTSVSVTIGTVTAGFDVTTVAAITTPAPFTFNGLANAPLNSVQVSDPVTISGINVSVPISIAGGAYNINGGAYTTAIGVVFPGDIVTVQVAAPSQYSTAASAMLTVGGYSAGFSVTTVAARIVPDAFGFAPVTGAALGSLQTSAAISVTGIDIAVPISIVGGSYSINGGAFTSAAGLVNPNDAVVVQQAASAAFSTKTTATLTIATVSANFDVTTLAAITTPSPFSFAAVTSAALGSVQTSNSITIGAINTAVPVSIAGGQYSLNGGAYTSAAGMVNPGDVITVRQTASSAFSTKTTATLTVSTVSAGFDVTTLAAITTPSPFSFSALSDVALNSVQTSNAITIGAINTAVPVSITGGTYSINGGADTSAAGMVSLGDVITVRQTASSAFSTKTTATLTVSTVSAGFDVTTLAAVTTPSPFSFNTLTAVALNSVQTSNTITVGGINTAVPVSITGGTYSINGGIYTNMAGMVNAGDTVTVRQTSSSAFSTKTTATLTISNVSAGFDVTTLAAVTTPSPFSFGALTGVALSSVQTSNSITVGAINTSVPVTVSGGTYSVNGGVYTSAAGMVSVGDVISVRQTASSAFSTKTTATLTVSTVSANFDVTTLAAITTPSPFSFTAVTNVPVGSLQTSNTITVGAINTAVPVTVTGGTYSINGGAFVSVAGMVNVNDTVAVRQTASASFSTKTTAVLTIGGVSASYDVTTAVARVVPDPFSFTAQAGVALNTPVTSNTVTVTGLDIPVALSITGGTYSLNGGAFTSASGTIKASDTIAVRQTSSGTAATKTTAVLAIGTATFNFDVTTSSAITTPNAFSFTAVTNAAVSSVQTSNTVTITGINVGVPVTVTGGSYSINGGAFVSTAGTVNPNDMVSVRQTASAAFATKTTTVLTIGGVSGSYDVTTTAADTTPDTFAFTAQTDLALNAVATSNAITVSGINTGVPISITGGTYSINGAAYVSAAGTVNAGDVVTVKVTASGSYATTVTAALTISTLSGSFAVTTATATLPVVTNEFNRDTRLLVLLSCENSQGNSDPACLASRKTFLTTYLTGLGLDFKLVTDADSFKSEFRCGRYNTYWIAGGALKLKDNLAAEIAEAVFRGDSLIVDGTHDNRNSDLDDILGVKFVGNLPQASSVQLTSAALPAGSIAITGGANKVTLTTGATLAAFNAANGNPAIVLNTYGQGLGLSYLFDWVGTLQTQNAPPLLTAVMNQSLTVVQPAIPAAVVGDAYVPLDTKVVNAANMSRSVDVIATVPTVLTAITPIVPAPASTVVNGSNTVYTWHLTIPANSTQFIDWAVRAPTATGTYAITYQANLIVGGNSTALAANNLSLVVHAADQGAAQTVTALQNLSLTANAEKTARNKAVTDVQTGNTKLAAGMYEDAVTAYLAAVNDLSGITSISTAANEAAIDRLLQEAGRKWCRAGSSCPVSNAGLPTAYHVTVFGSASFSNGQAGGSIGVGGSTSLSSYTVAANQSGDAARLIVGGSLTFSNGSVGQGGSGIIKAAGATSVSQNVGRASLQAPVSVEDWAALKTQYTTFSDSLAGLAGTAATVGAGNALTCAGTNADWNVCTLTGAQLTNARTLNLNYPNTANVLVNVTGSAAATASNGQVNWNGQALSGSAYSNRVFFNFAQASGITISGFGFGGTLLAPRSSLSHSNSAIDGQVIVNTLSSTGSYTCGGTFQGSLPVVP